MTDDPRESGESDEGSDASAPTTEEETSVDAEKPVAGEGAAPADADEPTASEDTPATTDSSRTLSDGLRLRGEVTGVERVPAADVPDDFPESTGHGRVVTLQLDLGRYGESMTYFAPAGTEADNRLSALLDVHDVEEARALVGASVLLDVREGHPVPVLPNHPGRGDERAVYGIIAGVAPSITIALFTFFGLGEVVFSPIYFGLYIVCTFLVLPVSVYVDGLHLRTTTDWGGRPLLWALLAIVPPLYVAVVPYYLLTRESARPLALDRPAQS